MGSILQTTGSASRRLLAGLHPVDWPSLLELVRRPLCRWPQVDRPRLPPPRHRLRPDPLLWHMGQLVHQSLDSLKLNPLHPTFPPKRAATRSVRGLRLFPTLPSLSNPSCNQPHPLHANRIQSNNTTKESPVHRQGSKTAKECAFLCDLRVLRAKPFSTPSTPPPHPKEPQHAVCGPSSTS
jgi:hypothetical protein